MFGARDTTFRSAASWGERALKFKPGVSVRAAGPPQTDEGPGYHAAMGGAKAHPSQVSVPAKDQFVAGGWNRNAALAHLRRDAEGRVLCEGGVLGETFNEYLRDMPPAELTRLHEDYTHGIDAWRHVSAAAAEELRPSDPVLLEQRKKRVPTKAEVFNSATVADHLEAACEEVTKCIASGALRVLGTVEEVAARGEMPLHLNPLTMETSKIRLCCNQRKLNSMSSWPTVELDGLQTTEDAVRGRTVHGAVSDEASGYHHHALSEGSQELFGVVFLGYVMTYTVLSFGWGPSCFYHQGHGMVPVGYHRSQGGLVFLYIDDHTLVGRDGADKSSTERDVYAFYSLKGLFGYYLSPTKTMWEVAEMFRTLGLECDTARQAWLVPADKRAEYIQIAEVLTRQLADGPPDPWALSRFAGKTVYYRRACDTLKYYQNLQYAVLTNRKLHREVVSADHRWWMERREDRRPLSRRLRRLLSEEIAMCVALVAGDQVHQFVSDEHVLLRSDTGRVQLFTDTTLHTFGAVLRDAEVTGGPRPEVVFGGVLPEEVAAVYIAKCNTGVVEIAGMVYTCRIIDRTPKLVRLVVNRMFDLLMDNFEDVSFLRSGKISGEFTVEKQQLLLEFRHYLHKWNARANVYYVKSAENPADAPSRGQSGAGAAGTAQGARPFAGEIRLLAGVFGALWREAGPFDVDAMASAANRQVVPDGDALPFISLGPDPESRSMNFFATRHGRDSHGVRERLYVNPPFVLQRAVVQWLKQCRGAGLLVIRNCAQPWPPWRVELARYTTRRWAVSVPHSEARRAEGMIRLESGPALEACEFDFEIVPAEISVAVKELHTA